MPIPVYAEMSSINPVILFSAALAARGPAIAQAFAASLTLGAGQFCTNPGLLLALEGPDIDAFVAEHQDAPSLAPFVEGLKTVKAQLQEATLWLMQNGLQNPENAGAASSDYLHLFGLTGLTWMWAKIAKAALGRIEAGDSDPFNARKLTTGRYFVERILPEAGAHLAKLKTGAALVMALEADAF